MDGASRRSAIESDRERRSLRRLVAAHERDRRLMAFEIHDGMVQHAVAARMHLESLLGTADAGRDRGNETDAGKALRLAVQQVDETIVEARRLIRGLRPPVLDELGLAAALEHLAGDLSEDGPVVVLDARLGGRRFEPLLEGTVFRIVQEALTNARRHSRSARVEATLGVVDDRIRIEIRDWGVGFDVKQVESTCFGLRGMRERAGVLQGRLTIESEPGEGTRIVVELPIL